MLVAAYPDSVSSKRFGRDGLTPLLAAVRRHAAPQTINALLVANPEQAFVATRAKTNLPLHEAIEQNAPVKVIKLILNTNPEAAVLPNRFHHTPLHLAIKSMSCIDVFKLLLEIAPQVARKTYSRVKSPLEMAAEEFIKAPTVTHASELVGPSGASWERFLLILRAAYMDLMGSKKDGDMNVDPSREWHVLHAAVSFNVPKKLLQTILLLYPHQISQVDSLGRTPLSIAADSGMEWENGLSTLFDAFPDAIWETDASTGLHVFMSAAKRKQNRLHSKPLSQLNTVYELLLAGPVMRYDAICYAS
jgi:ankyrin repeat protein